MGVEYFEGIRQRRSYLERGKIHFSLAPLVAYLVGRIPLTIHFSPTKFDYESSSKKEISIEELGSEDETQKRSEPSKELSVKNPNNETNGTQSFSFQRVAYGGINGMYYTTSIGRRTGGDGTLLVEIKEEDKTVGQALSTISKGNHEKGHSVTTKHNPDGKADSIQTLHNLYERLLSFEDIRGSINRGCDELAKWGGWALPYTEQWGDAGATVTDGKTGLFLQV